MKRLLPTSSKLGVPLLALLSVITGGLYSFGEFEQDAILWSEVLSQSSGPLIANVTTNAADYPNNTIPKFHKFELTFQVENTVAGNYQFPYDPTPPHGIDLTYASHQGISVDAFFLPPGQSDWHTAYRQPAFYFQGFDNLIKADQYGAEREWYYPTGEFSWKVRFAPNQPGSWQYRLEAVDASGSNETAPQTFTVIESGDKGFIHVSSTDPRYFEFDDSTPFHPVGFAYDADGPPAENELLKNDFDFRLFQQNRINLLRVWISGLYGSAWMHYLGGRNLYDGYLPRPGLVPFYDAANNRTTMALRLDYEPEGDTGWFDACRFRFWNDFEGVKPNTNYHLRIKYRGFEIAGPRDPAYPNYGLVGKFGDWHPNCYEPDTGLVITNYGLNNSEWQYLEGNWNSGSNNFLPKLYLGLENVTQGQVYVDSVSVREDLGAGQYGPEIMIEPSMGYELYFPQMEAYALDKLVEVAQQYDIYLKLVIMDKDDKIYYKLEDNGDSITTEDNPDGFYGIGRTLNKTRWLQQAWWRYLQARWGYSPNIHSWELTNEGDPSNENHYALTDEMGKFMHCRVFGVAVGSGDGDKCSYDHPNDHLVTTSFWHSFPSEEFWANPNYPNVDYADVHAYISTGWQSNPAHEDDAAQFHLDYSADVRSKLDGDTDQNERPTKPIIRGETGIDFVDRQEEQPDLTLDTQGVWLHNFLWSTLDGGAMTELYWWTDNIQNQPGPDGQPGLYEIYDNFSDFVAGIPLNNGHYEDLEATVSHPNLRVVGQKDLTHREAHMWVQNKQHTWRQVVDNVKISPISGSMTVSGFAANQKYTVQWWDTYATNRTKRLVKTGMITARPNGDIVLPISNLVRDLAIKIFKDSSAYQPVFLPIILKQT